MFSMCSELTPRAPIPDTRIPQLMQPWTQFKTFLWNNFLDNYSALKILKLSLNVNVFSFVVNRGYFPLILDQICTEFVRNTRKIENIYRNKKTSCERHVCRIRWFPDKQSFNLLSENQIEELTLSMFLRFCPKIVF